MVLCALLFLLGVMAGKPSIPVITCLPTTHKGSLERSAASTFPDGFGFSVDTGR